MLVFENVSVFGTCASCTDAYVESPLKEDYLAAYKHEVPTFASFERRPAPPVDPLEYRK